jgi:hypothetical protein
MKKITNQVTIYSFTLEELKFALTQYINFYLEDQPGIDKDQNITIQSKIEYERSGDPYDRNIGDPQLAGIKLTINKKEK